MNTVGISMGNAVTITLHTRKKNHKIVYTLELCQNKCVYEQKLKENNKDMRIKFNVMEIWVIFSYLIFLIIKNKLS